MVRGAAVVARVGRQRAGAGRARAHRIAIAAAAPHHDHAIHVGQVVGLTTPWKKWRKSLKIIGTANERTNNHLRSNVSRLATLRHPVWCCNKDKDNRRASD